MLIAGNWKMNASTDFATTLAGEIISPPEGVDILICPPAPYLSIVGSALADGIKLGGQDCHMQDSGAYTGCVSAEMLKDIGCEYVLVGHSERRAMCHETDKIVAEKAHRAKTSGLVPVICVGEQESSRDAGEHIEVVSAQIKNSIPDGMSAGEYVLAYEPVWAIGTGKTASLADIREMHDAIREIIGEGIDILYGGSVKPDNAKDILSIENVGGVLVGGASLKADDFNAIIRAGIL